MLIICQGVVRDFSLFAFEHGCWMMLAWISRPIRHKAGPIKSLCLAEGLQAGTNCRPQGDSTWCARNRFYIACTSYPALINLTRNMPVFSTASILHTSFLGLCYFYFGFGTLWTDPSRRTQWTIECDNKSAPPSFVKKHQHHPSSPSPRPQEWNSNHYLLRLWLILLLLFVATPAAPTAATATTNATATPTTTPRIPLPPPAPPKQESSSCHYINH